MSTREAPPELVAVEQRLSDSGTPNGSVEPERVSVRTLLAWFGYSRRGIHKVAHIRNTLEALGLQTNPDFEFTYIDESISIELDSSAQASTEAGEIVESIADPTVRIGTLGAANQAPIYVAPDALVTQAVTIMQLKDYSQLPVMVTEREVKGVISWKSIGARTMLGKTCKYVRDCMEAGREVLTNTPLLDAVQEISEHGYVLVRGEDNRIVGIVTSSDLGNQFMELAGPFLILGEIEMHLRRLVLRGFTLHELQDTSGGLDGHTIEGSADLTLGDICHLLEKKDNWDKLQLAIDRAVFVEHLDRVREIRNGVMHFHPDGIEPEDKETLRECARFLRNIAQMQT
ncbi:MAG: CBS domain-containing protein [Chloroflexi bacterium]|nr:CBS domain-containing protein [Chloroflexota bacterium]